MRILQVEDDMATARSVETMLASKGHQCETTALGHDGVARAIGGGYDLILLDIMLPDIDGYEVLRRLAQANVKTPVVIQTGIIARDEAGNGVSLGARYCLLKPFGNDELGECVAAALEDDDAVPVRAVGDELDRREGFRDAGQSRRGQPRMRTLKTAQIVYSNANCVADCTIVNTSDGGAALKLNDYFECPAKFLLKVHRGPTYRCEVCWQRGNKVGVRFVER